MHSWENPTLIHLQRDHWEHVELHPRCCLSWEQHLSTASPQPTTVVTPWSTRLAAHECSPACTPVYTHTPLLPWLRPQECCRHHAQLPGRGCGQCSCQASLVVTLIPTYVCLTPSPACPLLGSSQNHHCCGNAPLPWPLWRAKLVARTLAQPCSLVSPAGVCRQSQLLFRASPLQHFGIHPLTLFGHPMAVAVFVFF